MAFPWTADAGDEGWHPRGDGTLWNESWYFDFVSHDASAGGYVRLGRYPNLGVVWYWACLVGPDRRTVMVVDHHVPEPRHGSLEVRGEGLWADHTCESPFEHWSLGLESFGVALDEPADAYRGVGGQMVGDRTAFGFDLEWETDGEVFRYPPEIDRYEVPCRVHGEVLVGDERIEIDGQGQRDHSWGERDWWALAWCWSAFRLDDGTRLHAVAPEGLPFAIGYVQPPDGEPEVVVEASVATDLGDDGIPTSTALTVAGQTYTVEPLGWAPVALVSPQGEVARFPRAMARFTGSDATTGTGWIEFNQPPRPGVDSPAPTVL